MFNNYSYQLIKGCFIVLLLLIGNQLLAQVPVINYGSSSFTFKAGTTITTVTPTATGSPIINGQTSTFASGMGQPLGAVMDAFGNVYIADAGNHVIRQVSPNGNSVIFAGASGLSGSANGKGTAARFNHPVGLAIDASGNLYVADEDNHMIRKIDPLGNVTTLAGTAGTAGSTNGTLSTSTFKDPCGVAIGTSGIIYVADTFNNEIRTINIATGTVSTLAGSTTSGWVDGSGTVARFNSPFGITLDASNNLYITDRLNQRIRKVTSTGIVTTLAGSGTAGSTNGTATAASFNTPTGIVADNSGNLYVTDEINQKIRAITPTGIVTTLSGTAAVGSVNGPGNGATFNDPFGIAIDKNTGLLYVGDSGTGLLRKVASTPFTISPALPAGLSFNQTNGAISGTPTTPTLPASYTVTAYNNSGPGTVVIAIAIANPTVLNLNAAMNYIATYSPRNSGITTNAGIYGACTDKTQMEVSLQYADGLGRPIQTVQLKGSPAGNDMVQPIAYDAMNRQSVKYLPYAVTGSAASDGSYKATAITDQASFYATPPSGVAVIPNASSPTGFEPSPLNRVIEQGAPGAPWQLSTSGVTGSGHTIKISYGTNAAADVISWTVNSGGTGATGTSNYGAGQLYATTTADENQNNTIEYKDKEGHVVCKKAQSGSSTYLSTYYVYNDLNELAYVIPPIPTTTTYPTSFTETDAVFLNFIYGYHYDQRSRLIEKKIPGKGWEYMIYNALDQVVATQDANQRSLSPQQWTFIKYDGQGRVIISGIYLYTGTAGVNYRSVLQGTVDAQTTVWETPATTGNGYTTLAWPTSWTGGTLTVNYYDNYTFPNNPYTSFTSSLPVVTSLLTASQTAILNSNGTIGSPLWEVHGYDGLGRETLNVAQHYQGGAASYSTNNFDIITSIYNFDNTLAHTSRAHILSSGGPPQIGIGTSYFYDHMGRPTQVWKVIWNEAFAQPAGTLISQMDYNEIGQLKAKHLHQNSNGSFVQDINYAYNERGWLKTINNAAAVSATQVFGEQLQYNDGPTPQYNGNITGASWQTMVPAGLSLFQGQQNYAYTYDQLNRLTLANYTTTGATGKFNEQVVYDEMGNITILKRTNSTTANTYLNNFTYNYTGGGVGNKLWSVSDAGTAAQSSSYQYNLNGNAISDSRNQVTNIVYNLLNLPATVTRTPGNMNYTYDANGRKLQKIASGITRDYINGIEYNNGNVDFVATEEGRATLSGTTYVYEYYLKDHLGNTRAAIKQDGSITQVQDYYAFGMEMNPGNSLTPSPANQYKYNGKEEQAETGQYDYGARFYDPVIGRFNTIDRYAEKYSVMTPYHYAAGNPVLYVDENGDSLNVAKQYRDQLNASLKTEFGDNASKFSYNASGNLTYSGDTKGLSDDQTKALNGLQQILGETVQTNLIYGESTEITLNDGNKQTLNAKDYGGAVTALVGDVNVSQNTILIDPNNSEANSLIKNVFVVTDAYYKGFPIDPSNGPRFKQEDIKTNLTATTFHEFGHVLHKGQSQDKVLDYDNTVRKTLGLPQRPYDESHNKTVTKGNN